MIAKFVLLALCLMANHISSAQDACATDAEEMLMEGRAMLQIAEQAPHSRSQVHRISRSRSQVHRIHSYAPKENSKANRTSKKKDASKVTSKGKASPKATSKGKASSKAASKGLSFKEKLLKLKDQLLNSATGKAKKSQKAKKSRKARSPDASNVALNNAGYTTIANQCCNYEMEQYIRRVVDSQGLKVCQEGGVQGTVPYHTCENKQNFSILLTEVNAGQTGACAWTAPKASSCPKISKACGSTNDPMSHRRRNCGRADTTGNLDLEMQNAATQEFVESKCGTHQKYTDVKSDAGVLKSCKIKGDITENNTAINLCLNECCGTAQCIGITVSDSGTLLQKSYEDAEAADGSIVYLHRQR